ncbi:hypothetical protein AB0M95_03520 [Sphaerisporangium sp. NPDC051017]|uniref:hypothetical protein n=1 Tax=Sphaerisporangium sp. NPDC051017 TaxID=3154636 RepID=UPI00343B935A
MRAWLDDHPTWCGEHHGLIKIIKQAAPLDPELPERRDRNVENYIGWLMGLRRPGSPMPG